MDETWWVNPDDLDPQQREVVLTNAETKLLVVGPPGSGKTNILILRANYVRDTCPRILFLTFTRTLAEFLKSGPNVGRADQLHADEIKTFMSWAKGLIAYHGFQVLETDNFDDLRRSVVETLRRVVDVHGLRGYYDAVFIDEVQDFLREELNVIRSLCDNVNAAGDIRQRIWEHREGIPTARDMVDQEIQLEFHYRIGQNICSYADQIFPPPQGMPPLLEGCNYPEELRPSSVEVRGFSTQSEIFRECLGRIKQQLRYISNESIAVVSCRGASRDAFWRMLQEDGELTDRAVLQKLGEYQEFDQNSQVRVMTIHSAKGSECRAVHIIDAEYFDERSRELAFTAVTRAKTEVSVYHTGHLVGYMTLPREEPRSFESIF